MEFVWSGCLLCWDADARFMRPRINNSTWKGDFCGLNIPALSFNDRLVYCDCAYTTHAILVSDGSVRKYRFTFIPHPSDPAPTPSIPPL